jgi:hypothetical protein
MEAYGKIGKPYWDDKPVAIVGGGPSLRGFDFETLRGCHVLAVKGCIFDIPWADAGFGLDMPRYHEWRDKLANVQSRVYWAVPEDQLSRTAPPPSKNVTFLRRLDGQSLSNDPGVIYGGGTSGFGSVQICIHKRAKLMVLLGFDYDGNYDAANASGQGFRHNDQHYQKKRAQNAANWEAWAEHFRVYVPYLSENGITVLNACPQSQINCFQKVTLGDGVAVLKSGV